MALAMSAKIGLVLLVIGAIIFFVGFCTPNWAGGQFTLPQSVVDLYSFTSRGSRRPPRFVRQQINFGLWRQCQEFTTDVPPDLRVFEGCSNVLGDETDNLAGEYRATQFFETMAFLLLIPAFVCLVLGACLEACKNRRILPILAGVCAAVAAGCIFLGAIIWGTWDSSSPFIVSDNLSWSFALAIVGGVFVAFSGVIILVGAILRK